MMLVDAGRTKEALELDQALLGYLKEEDSRLHDVLQGNSAEVLLTASKCVLLFDGSFYLSQPLRHIFKCVGNGR